MDTPRRSKRGRRIIEPLFDGPIPDNPEYRAMVEQILRDKRKREMIEAYRNQVPARNDR